MKKPLNIIETDNYQYNDGGRADSGYKGVTGDCGVRAICIVTGKPYQEVYDLVIEYGKKERKTAKIRKKGCSHPRTGIWVETMKKIMTDLGWKWVATMQIGSGCQVHVKADELPSGNIICRVSKHYIAMVDGIIYDTYDSSRGGTRCVYGYWIKN